MRCGNRVMLQSCHHDGEAYHDGFPFKTERFRCLQRTTLSRYWWSERGMG
jgi:hypothetical protein